MGFGRVLRPSAGAERGVAWFNMTGAPGIVSSAAYEASGSLVDALRNAASFACIDVLSDGISRTPFDVIRKVGGKRLPVAVRPSVIESPSRVVTADVWYSQLAFAVLTDGNGFARLELNGAGQPVGAEVLPSASVVERRVVDGAKQVTIDREAHWVYPHGDILHIPGRVVQDGSPFAVSPLAVAASTIGTSLTAESFSTGWLQSGGHPSALIYSAQKIDSDEAKAIKAAFVRATRGGTGEPAVLGNDLRYERIQGTPADSQFLDLMAFEVLQACRFWRVPPSLAYAAVSGQNVTYSNISDADLQFLKHSLDGYLVRFEESLSGLLRSPQFVRANRNAVLRMDATRRHEVYAARLAAKTMTVNEVRRLEDEPPFADPVFDLPGVPATM